MSCNKEKMYDITVNSMLESVFIFDIEGKIIDCNASAKKQSGYDEEIYEVSMVELFPRIMKIENGKISFMQDGDSGDETVIYCKNQTCSPVQYKLVVVNNEECYGIINTLDISKTKQAVRSKKEALDELEAAIQLKNEFVANITHELRTPVNGIKGLAENLLDTVLTPSQIESVNIIKRCCENMSKIINDLLDFSKLEAGKLTIESREFDFRKFLDETLAFHSIRINEKGLKFIVNIGPDVPQKVIGDELRLGQILNNLFSNAVKFTTVGSVTFEVVVTNRTDKNIELFFIVADTGIGIAPENRDKLFKSFTQVDGSITRRFGGTGLGLAISKQLVEMMDGTIQVEGEKGKGSTFSFTARFERVQEGEEVAQFPSGKMLYTGAVVEESPEIGKDYMKELFEKAKMPSYGNVGSFVPLGDNDIEDSPAEIMRKAVELIEKITMCMSLGTWEKAENFASQVKNNLAKVSADLKKKAFRLEMDIRKEDYESAEKMLSDLKADIEEMQNEL